MRFVALKDFFSQTMRSQYAAGMEYKISPYNHALRAEFEKWRAEGLVRSVDSPEHAAAQIEAYGIVSAAEVTKPSLWKRLKSWL